VCVCVCARARARVCLGIENGAQKSNIRALISTVLFLHFNASLFLM